MTIIKCLDLSTGHVPQNFAKIKIPFRRVSHKYGWILYLRTELDEHEVKQLQKHKFLHDIYKLAKKHKCDMVNFDRDADEIKNLETFDW